MASVPSAGQSSKHWMYGVVLLGLGLQSYHFLRQPSLWHDEAALVLNVLSRDFHQLLGPLMLCEAAPPLFLWLERAIVLVLGDGLYALRLVPFVSSCLALLLFARLARHRLPGPAAAWTVLLFACSDRFLWHSCEAKPYATDLFLGTLVLTAYTFTPSWPLLRRLLLFTLMSPILIWLSYPGCFLCGGLLLAMLPEVARARRTTTWMAYAAWAVLTGLSFGLLLLGPVQAQRCGEMTKCWTELFADWSRPWSVPAWCATSTLDLFHYFCNPIGEFLVVLVPGGLWALRRQGERGWLLLLVAPAGLALLAALLGRYPYGGARVMFFAAPAGLLLLGTGLAQLPHVVAGTMVVETDRTDALALTSSGEHHAAADRSLVSTGHEGRGEPGPGPPRTRRDGPDRCLGRTLLLPAHPPVRQDLRGPGFVQPLESLGDPGRSRPLRAGPAGLEHRTESPRAGSDRNAVDHHSPS